MPRGEAVAARMAPDVRQPQRLGMHDELAEHAAPSRQRSDRRALLVVDTQGQELRQLVALLVEHPDGRIARAGDLTCGLKNPIEHDTLVELRRQCTADLEQAQRPMGAGTLRSSFCWAGG